MGALFSTFSSFDGISVIPSDYDLCYHSDSYLSNSLVACAIIGCYSIVVYLIVVFNF